MPVDAITSTEDLRAYAELSTSELEAVREVVANHPMRITPYYLGLIDWDDPDDPIRKMAIPTTQESLLYGEVDTSGEEENTKLKGLQHKYEATVLLLTTSECAMFCRHCFRKRLVGVSDAEILEDMTQAIEYIRGHESVTNALVTGGDPLLLSTKVLEDMLGQLASIPHLKFIRIGTRTPVVWPSRISKDDKLIRVLRTIASGSKQLYFVTQFNHPREITPESIEAVSVLQDCGIIVNNQTVLLRGVNDDASVMSELQNSLAGMGAIPYYVFQCRPATGVGNIFQVPIREACDIMDKTTATLAGISKRFRFVMSHKTGKIEILGREEDVVHFKYHQTGNKALSNKMFTRKLDKNAGWLDDEPLEAK